MNKLNLKSAIIIALFALSIKSAFATIVTSKDTANVSFSFVNTDIDKDGLWDIRMRKKSTDINKIEIELAYTDANSYTSIKVNSAQDPTPIAYSKDIDINATGTWVNSSNGFLFINDISDYQSGTRYIGIRIVKNNIVYCSWIQVYFKNTNGELYRGTYAWENNNTKCLKTGEIANTSAIQKTSTELSKVSIYPNPSNHQISFNGLNDNNTLTIYNMLGQFVLTLENAENNKPIDISKIPNGLYLVKIESIKNETQILNFLIN